MILGGLGPIILLFVLLGAGLFLWLKSCEEKLTRRGALRLPSWRLVIATVSGLVALLAGGFLLVFLPDLLRGSPYLDPALILTVGGVPLSLSLLAAWLALRRPRV